jgi:hypothetical protein
MLLAAIRSMTVIATIVHELVALIIVKIVAARITEEAVVVGSAVTVVMTRVQVVTSKP